ncbi:polysaccharide deacetylase family protein [Patulibacter americanus]|uniref:polysaccharide deacetylase family protein n=1 Tax=Patulibacter americanus TaxID=588672 RepID=UPI0003B53764|nr:polysaccharide deacetylase family protein [Patulibacter americanus]
MAPSGPPTGPAEHSDPSDGPRRREAADWDWGGGWESPAERRPLHEDGGEDGPPDPVATDHVADDGARGAQDDGRSREDAAQRDDAHGGHAAREADLGPADDADGSASAPGDTGTRPRRRPVAAAGDRRRRGAAVAAALAVLAVVAGAVFALTGGGDGPAAAGADGQGLRADASAASAAAADRIEQAAALERYARIGRPIYCGAGRKPWVALTFDDGPGELSPRFITLLSKERVPATMFRIGRNVPGHEEYVKVQRNLGWDSGTHTQNHPFLARLSAKEQRAEIEAGNRASEVVLGRPAALFRPPYESHDRDTDRIVEEHGMVEVLWNVDTQDALGTTSADEIVETAKKGMRPGSIILMHEVKPNTLAAMPRIIAALREKGLEPVTVSRMLAEDGPTERQLQQGYDGCSVDLTPGKAAS